MWEPKHADVEGIEVGDGDSACGARVKGTATVHVELGLMQQYTPRASTPPVHPNPNPDSDRRLKRRVGFGLG